jgi:hypothetical protein
MSGHAPIKQRIYGIHSIPHNRKQEVDQKEEQNDVSTKSKKTEKAEEIKHIRLSSINKVNQRLAS